MLKTADPEIADVLSHADFHQSPMDVHVKMFSKGSMESPQFVGPVHASDSAESWENVRSNSSSSIPGIGQGIFMSRKEERELHSRQVMDSAFGKWPRQSLGSDHRDGVYDFDPWKTDDRSPAAAMPAASPLGFPSGGQAAAAPPLWKAPGMAAAPPSFPPDRQTSSSDFGKSTGSFMDAWHPKPKGPSHPLGTHAAQSFQHASGLPSNLASVLLPATTNPQILRGLNNQARGVLNVPEQPGAGFQPQHLLAQGVGQPGIHEVHVQNVSDSRSQEHVALRASMDPSTVRAMDAVGESIHVGERSRTAAHREKVQGTIDSNAPPEMLA